MSFRSLFLPLVLIGGALFAHPDDEQQQPLCPDYGVNRVGSMYTDGYGVIVYGDVLYWTSQLDGLELAFKTTLPLTNTTAHIIDQPFEWDAGFRVGLGYYFKWRDWGVVLEWTRYRTDSHRSLDDNGGNDLMFSLWGRPGPTDLLRVRNISGHWDFDYDVLDLVLHPGAFRYKYFSFQPEFGLRGAWLDFDYTIRTQTDDLTNNQTIIQHFPYSQDFHAIGIVGALNMKWMMGWGFNIYGKLLGSTLYGHYTTDQGGSTTVGNMTNTSTLIDKYWRVRTALNYTIGLEWERFFANNGVRLDIHVGWELQSWKDFNQLFQGETEVINVNTNAEIRADHVNGDLGLSGLTAGVRLEF